MTVNVFSVLSVLLKSKIFEFWRLIDLKKRIDIGSKCYLRCFCSGRAETVFVCGDWNYRVIFYFYFRNSFIWLVRHSIKLL